MVTSHQVTGHRVIASLGHRVIVDCIGPQSKNGPCGPSEELLCIRLLLRGHQVMCDGMHRERDAVLHPDLAHQLGDVGFDRALLDAQR